MKREDKAVRNKRRFSNIVAFLIILVATLALWTILYPILTSAIEKEEKRECIQWQKWSKEREIFWLTPWQKEQCDAAGIKIDAPAIGK